MRFLKWVGVAVAVPSAVLVILIAAFVARSELAHDEETCPFEEVARAPVAAGIELVDERRRCQESVEEHRWVVLRGEGRHEIGRRRLAADAYGPDRYSFTTSIEDGFVHVRIQNRGIEPAHFREGPE